MTRDPFQEAEDQAEARFTAEAEARGVRILLDYTDSDGDSIAVSLDPLPDEAEDVLILVRQDDAVAAVRIPLAVLRAALA